MTKFKLIIIFVFLVLGIQYSFSQVYKYKTTGFSVLERNDKGKWGKWSDLEKVNLLVTLDIDKNRIIVYSREIQLYTIMNYEKKEENEADEIFPFSCSDMDGQPFLISIIIRKKQNFRKQLYINQKNVILQYNIEEIIDIEDFKK
jgi:hypothetical protein